MLFEENGGGVGVTFNETDAPFRGLGVSVTTFSYGGTLLPDGQMISLTERS